MEGALGFFSMMICIASVYGHTKILSSHISSSEKLIENIQLSLPELNDSDIPAWVDEWKAPETFPKLFPFYLSGFDSEGSPVYVMEFGRWQVAQAIRASKDGPEKAYDLIIKYTDQDVYRIYRDGMANNTKGIGAIIDFDGFGLSNYASPLGIKAGLRQLATLDRLNKVLNYAFLINMNFASENLITLARPLLGNILDKFEFFGSQKYKWLPHLARQIPVSQLPPWYGGTQDWKPLTIGLEPLNSTHASTT